MSDHIFRFIVKWYFVALISIVGAGIVCSVVQGIDKPTAVTGLGTVSSQMSPLLHTPRGHRCRLETFADATRPSAAGTRLSFQLAIKNAQNSTVDGRLR